MEQDIFSHLIKVLEKNEYVQILGIEIEELKKGYCRGKMRVTDKNKNPYGALHGGSLYSLADIIAGTAACTYGNYVVTVSGTMNFLLPAEGIDYVFCEANVVRQGVHLGVYDVKLTDEGGNVLENASFTFFITENRVME
ncbi:MAG: PaaI family thioesterase [Lachnospiraceae bacterium]